MKRDVAFTSEGATLRGSLLLPDASVGAAAAIVMAHGTSATITMVIDRYAAVFCDAGFAVLLYDHRNFGISDGAPRREINPWVQARGFRDAITFLEQVEEVDSTRIGLWGDSFSGGEAILVAAMDTRVKAVVTQCPVCGSRAPAPDSTGTRFSTIKAIFDGGDVSGTPETTTGPMPVVSFDQIRHPSLLKPLTAYRWFIEHGGRHGSRWENDVTRVIPPTPASFSPGLCAPHVKVPTLMMVAPEDEMVQAAPEVAHETYERLGGPKQWYEIAGGHFGLLWHPSDLFNEASSVQANFFLANLV